MKKKVMYIYNNIRNLMSKNVKVDNLSHYKVWKYLKADRSSKILTKKISIRSNTHIEAKKGGIIEIGNNTNFNYNNLIVAHKRIKIGNNCLFGPNVVIYDHDHDYKSSEWRTEFKTDDVIIGDNVWIGANVIILKGTIIEDNSIIGAGTILKGKKINNNTIAYTKNQLTEREKGV